MAIEYIQRSWWVIDERNKQAWEFNTLWEAVLASIIWIGVRDGQEEKK